MLDWHIWVISASVVLLAIICGFALGVMIERDLRRGWFDWFTTTHPDLEKDPESYGMFRTCMLSPYPAPLDGEDLEEDEKQEEKVP